jgi:hypothetical protein
MTRTITAHGRTFEVKTLDTGAEPAKRFRKRFTKVPGVWEEVLSKARVSSSTIWVAHTLLYEAWRARKSTVTLTSKMLKRVHVGRDGKYKALRKLAELHLITVKQANGRNPIVTAHFTD